MPISTVWMCASCFYWETRVEGSKGDLYHVHWGRYPEGKGEGKLMGWQCSCKGYRYRDTCRHIKEIERANNRCAWNEEADPTLECDHDEKGQPTCPKCGGIARSYKKVQINGKK